MRYNAVIYLCKLVIMKDDIGQQVKRLSEKRKVYANEFSISRAEFAAAGEIGLRGSLAYQINSIDYSGEEYVYVGNERYHVYRDNKAGDKTTLYLEKAVADGIN